MKPGDMIVIEDTDGNIVRTEIAEISSVGLHITTPIPCSTHACFTLGWKDIKRIQVLDE